jgi:hypothetical protein
VNPAPLVPGGGEDLFNRLRHWQKERVYTRCFYIQNFDSAQENAIKKPIEAASRVFVKAFCLLS